MSLINCLKNYFSRKESTNPTDSTNSSSIEDYIIKTENNPLDPNSVLVYIKGIDDKIMIYSIHKRTISEQIIRERCPA